MRTMHLSAMLLGVVFVATAMMILSRRASSLQHPSQKYQSAVDYIMETHCVSNDTVVVRLPHAFERLTVDKLAYITYTSEGCYVVFRTAHGKGGDFEGYLHTRVSGIKKGDKLLVNSMLPGRVGEIEVNIQTVLDAYWYSIGTDYLN